MEKKTLIILIVSSALVIAIIAGIILSRPAPQTEAPVATVDLTPYIKPVSEFAANKNPTNFMSVSNSFHIEEGTPTKVPSFNYKKSSFTSEQNISNLINKLGLQLKFDQTDSVLGRTILASDGKTKSLTAYVTNNQLNYLDSYVPGEPKLDPAIPVSQYENGAKAFVNDIGFNLSNYELTKYVYFEGSESHGDPENRPENATFIVLYFEAKLNGIPIIDKQKNIIGNSLSVWMDRSVKVRKFTYEGVGEVGNSIKEHNLKNVDEIRGEINSRGALLIGGTFQVEGDATKVEIEKASLSYLSTDNQLVPVYVLEAKVATQESSENKGYLIINAAKD